MNRISSAIQTILISLIVLQLASCGSSDEFAFVFVSDFSVDPGTSRVGDQATVVVVFESSSRSNFDFSTTAEDTDLAVVLPRGVDFVDNSSEFAGSSLGAFDLRAPNSIDACNDGSQALLYRFQKNELSTEGDNRVRLKIVPVEQRGTVTLRAEADSLILSPCNIAGQGSDSLIINP